MAVRVPRLLVQSLTGAITGFVLFVLSYGSLYRQPDNYYRFLAGKIPLPHHVPQYSGAAALRFAMVHDVIHERFTKHGLAWYEARNRRSLELLATLPEDNAARWPLIDDIAVALDRLGKPGEAIPLMRTKLAQQEASGLEGRELYTSFANLGTFLIHANFGGMRKGDAAAVAEFEEGLGFVRRSIEVNPTAHFGREKWQAAIAEFLLRAARDSSLLQRFDCLGNRLDLSIESILDRNMNWVEHGYGRAGTPRFWQGKLYEADFPLYFDRSVKPDAPESWAALKDIRSFITSVGAEHTWDEVGISSHSKPVPFDEPVLGIIGMWRQGGGANPHFALALGETMLRVGQRYIAWAAFERASELAEGYSPDPKLQEFLRTHCRERQAQLEETLLFSETHTRRETSSRHETPWQHVSPPPSKQTVDSLREAFRRELQFGLSWQKDYQDFEAAHLGKGKSPNSADFFDEFLRSQPAIASIPGPEEYSVFVRKSTKLNYIWDLAISWGFFGFGVGFMFVAVIEWIVLRIYPPKSEPTSDDQILHDNGPGETQISND